MVSVSRQLPQDVGFLVIVFGGIGRDAGGILYERFHRDMGPFPMKLIQIDTDPQTSDCFDDSICPRLDAEMLAAMRADPDKFGPAVPTILDRFQRFLSPDDLANGSRTIRSLTQLAWAFHRAMIIRHLRQAIQDLLKAQRLSAVVPVIVSSSGGGCGSAGQILLLSEFAKLDFRHLLLEGMSSSLLRQPVSFVVEPFALAQLHSSLHHSRILANAMAFRIESEHLERRGATKYVFHLGLSNRHGTILSEPSQISRVLGTTVYEFLRNWSEFRARFVDLEAATVGAHYSGRDLPELMNGNAFHRRDALPPAANAEGGAL